jgi:ATP-dependent Lon protease
MATSLVSLISGRKVRPRLGMTGEITLRGQVLPIGGVKEKVLAAHRNGLKTVILPRRNEQDLEDVTAEVRDAMQFVLVDTVDDVLNAALEAPTAQEDKPKPRAKPTLKKTAAKSKPAKTRAKPNAKSTAGRR